MLIVRPLASFLGLLILLPLVVGDSVSSFTKAHLQSLRAQTKELFDHGWRSYIQFGYPADEVRPLSCIPYGPNYSDSYDLRNDVLGNFSVTLLDLVDTFIIMHDYEGFRKGVDLILSTVTFDSDSAVQVFETSIRALGLLLSLHLFASDRSKGFYIPGYSNELLDLAYELGLKLLPAYSTPSGIPYPRVNLRRGVLAVPSSLQYETCTAGAGLPMLEMALLLRLTGNPSFEEASRNAFMTLWELRTSLNLVPMGLSPVKSRWLGQTTGIGASIDSFYEYALKGAILFDDAELFSVWETSYKALSVSAKADWFYTTVDAETGYLATGWVDSLSAFFPGLQVLAGRLSDAQRTYLLYYKLWGVYGALPERWNFQRQRKSSVKTAVALEWYPLRPEFIESTYHLYRATRDPLYLQVGVAVLKAYQSRFMATCGFAGIQDIRIGTMQDRMESFVLSETFKYLYLLFDEDNIAHQENLKDAIFSTEGHLLWLDRQSLDSYTPASDNVSSDLVSEDSIHENLEPAISELLSQLLSSSVERVKQFSQNFLRNDYGKLRKYYATSRSRLLDYNQMVLETKINKTYMAGLPSELVLVDEDLTDAFEMCEVPSSNPPFSSAFMSWDRFYEIDDRYSHALIAPPYRSAAPLEQEEGFLSIWGANLPQCARRPTTESFEVLFGDKKKLRLAQVDHILGQSREPKLDFEQPKAGDFWVPHLDGIRLRMEKLEPRKIDSRNREVSSDYINALRAQCIVADPLENYDLLGSCDTEEAPKVLRVELINGNAVHENVTIWISRTSVQSLAPNTQIFEGRNGSVLLGSDPIENLRIYEGGPQAGASQSIQV